MFCHLAQSMYSARPKIADILGISGRPHAILNPALLVGYTDRGFDCRSQRSLKAPFFLRNDGNR